ncbi:MAG: DUF3800 domain-containing protein [Candidatus Omnitrophica bacterium]|nr:DUF3800 domain-containing protein [Candidatus Omnitrophota bacterium]
MNDNNQKEALYIFLDEGGNLDFSDTGTKYFTLTALSKIRPFEAYKHLNELKYNLVEQGIEIEYFRASEDRQSVRDSVFNIIDRHLDQTRIDSLIVEKRKTGPSLRGEERFYPDMLGYLLLYVINGYDLRLFEKIIVFTDSIPILRKRKAIEKTIKKVLAHKLPAGRVYYIFHHASKSNYDLQIVDYCNWAVYRKWERQDLRSYETIERVVESEFDIFKNGSRYYY